MFVVFFLGGIWGIGGGLGVGWGRDDNEMVLLKFIVSNTMTIYVILNSGSRIREKNTKCMINLIKKKWRNNEYGSLAKIIYSFLF